MKILLVLAAFFTTFSLQAKHYGASGCGVGSYIMPKKGVANQVLAATTSGTSSQTSAITSGTSNCGAHASRKMALVPYVETNKAQLLSEMAKGRGESLAGLAELMGCANQQRVNAVLQQHLPTSESNNLTDHIYQVLEKQKCAIYF